MYRLMFRAHIDNAGKRQSPIDIKTEKCCIDKQKCDACHLQIDSHSGDLSVMTVNPSAWKALVRDECRTTIRGPHLPGTFRLAQFHAHWSNSSDCGSEHTINGKHFGGEVHFVFWNTRYGTCEVAAAQPDGLAVVGVFLAEGDQNDDFQIVVDLVEKAAVGGKADFPSDFEISRLIPLGSEYFTYEGSLTTAPYSETVVWTVMMKPIWISKEQFDVFRRVCSKNYRECQPICDRQVFSSMEFNGYSS